MLFNFKYKHHNYKGLTSGQIKKMLSIMGYSAKKQKYFIRTAIRAFSEGRPHYEVKGIPHITVVPGTARKHEGPITHLIVAGKEVA